jgi:hypothetical protein
MFSASIVGGQLRGVTQVYVIFSEKVKTGEVEHCETQMLSWLSAKDKKRPQPETTRHMRVLFSAYKGLGHLGMQYQVSLRP